MGGSAATLALSGIIAAGDTAEAGLTRARQPPTPMQTVEFTTDKRFLRRRRELKIIQTMVGLYCRGKRHAGRAPLCTDCAALLEYATRRLERCVFGDAKPTCAKCVVHCYRTDMRERIRAVMRWAGPRMMLRHPIMAMSHMIDERRPVPMLPVKKTRTPP
ncbi:MAG TPA: nitrous oxide-stimulated promoter family protein [Ramlibacter sp.]